MKRGPVARLDGLFLGGFISRDQQCIYLVYVCVNLHTLTYTTVRLTSIYNPEIGGKFTETSGGLTNLPVALTSLSSDLVNATIKKIMAPLEVGPEFTPN